MTKRAFAGTIVASLFCGMLLHAQKSSRSIIDEAALLRDLDVLAADDMQGRKPGTAGHDRARDFIIERFRESALEPVNGTYLQPFTFTTRRQPDVQQPGTNIIGAIRGAERPDIAIVITAHYDHIGVVNGEVFNGADDNASGTAALFALARYFVENRPGHTFVFAALDAEEMGLRGARAFLDAPPVPLGSIALNVNLDMIGRDSKDTLYAAGVSKYPYLRPVIEPVAARAPLKLVLGHDGPGAPAVDDWTRESDHYAFHERGIPFLYFGVEDEEQHHKATDDPGTITRPFYVKAVGTVLDALRALDVSAGQILAARAQGSWPQVTEGDFIARDFRFASGETLAELRLHYRTLGSPRRDANGRVTNAVLIMHGTTGSGAQFIRREFAGELFGPGQLLDATRFFIVLPDGIGHGKSGKPSDGLHARFPRYNYADMVGAQHQLLTEGLGVNHLRLVMGTSMGGMQTWIWGERYPGFMDALMPLASLPTQISGRNRAWRRVAIDAIRHDPEWKAGEYTAQPQSLRTAAEMLFLVGSNPVLRQKQAPTLAQADRVLDEYVANAMKTLDANDVLYALEASRDYDPGPGLETIQAPLLAINSADDLINPPELGILEREIKRIKNARAIVIPLGDRTAGHGTHTLAAVWKLYLGELLAQSGSK
jgi:homoserine O-acetyltransferase